MQRLSEKDALLSALRKRQSELCRNVESWAEMSQPEIVKLIEKLHWEENYSLRDIAKMFGRSWWWIVNFKKKHGFKVKSRTESLYGKYDGHGPNWAGGKFQIRGYWIRWVGKEYPNANKRGYIFEHRYVMSKKIGRPLKDYEVVHHIDGNKENNHSDNLQLMTQGGRGKFHGVPIFCPKCNYELKQF